MARFIILLEEIYDRNNFRPSKKVKIREKIFGNVERSLYARKFVNLPTK